MKNKVLVFTILIAFLTVGIYFVLSKNKKEASVPSEYKVTFIELGSVKCIPCRKMELVLDKIRKKYPKDVKVIFYDVWTKKGKPYGVQYNIRMIPTQIFLDNKGDEYYRHVGYFPEKEVIKILKTKNVTQ